MVSRSLCFDVDLSPLPLHTGDDFPDVFFSSPCRWSDDDSRDSGYNSTTDQSVPLTTSPTESCNKVRRSLFSGKRCRADDDVDADVVPKRPRLPATTRDTDGEIRRRLEGEGHLIGDGSQENSLPTVCGSKPDLTSVTPATVSELLDGIYDDISSFLIIDCRYPYEFEGGHIKDAVNIHTQEGVDSLLSSQSRQPASQKKRVLVFHCEFSSERAPKLLRYLRNQDRQMNSDQYPKLFFPEIYLLSGGYKAFFQQHKNHCTPVDYVTMLDGDHAADLRHFRSRSKSWTAGQRRRRCQQFQDLCRSPSFF